MIRDPAGRILRKALAPVLQDEFDVSSTSRRLRHLYHDLRLLRRPVPRTPQSMRESALFKSWWYYSAELFPGLVAKGIYADDLPFAPRMLMRHCALQGMDCLDLGSMEGLMPVLMRRMGARSVLATDAVFHCYDKMDALKRCYGVDFGFRQVGLMYDLARKLKDTDGFDFINLSGILYHVFSPIHVLAGARPLLRRNGLMIVSTNVINRPGLSMEFNDHGKLQDEQNTFWYLSIPVFDYLLRYFRLLPIDCVYMPRTTKRPVPEDPAFNAGYLCVVCRATDEFVHGRDDAWAAGTMIASWEYANLVDTAMLSGQGLSDIRYGKALDQSALNPDGRSIDLKRSVDQNPPLIYATEPQDTHLLQLGDRH